MEILILSLLAAIAKIFVLAVLFGSVAKMLWWSKAIDIVVLFLLPWLFYGTFSGVILAIFSGLWICMFLALLKLVIKPVPPSWTTKLRYGKTRRHHTDQGIGIADTFRA